MAAIFRTRARCLFRSLIFVGTSAITALSPSGHARGSPPTLFPGRSACDRARRSGRRLHGGALHARRQAGASLPRGSGGALDALGHKTTIDYLQAMCARVLRETGLLPRTPTPESPMSRSGDRHGLRTVHRQPRDHAGIAQRTPLRTRRRALWLTLTSSPRRVLETLQLAGELRVPFTTGILIGIGETRAERLEALFANPRSASAVRRAYSGSHRPELPRQARNQACRRWAEPDLDDLLWSLAAARSYILGAHDEHPGASQPFAGRLSATDCGGDFNDWGGISPVTPDHVNPEGAVARRSPSLPSAPRPLASCWCTACRSIPSTCRSILRPGPRQRSPLQARRLSDAEGFARDDNWAPGTKVAPRHAVLHPRARLRRSSA